MKCFLYICSVKRLSILLLFLCFFLNSLGQKQGLFANNQSIEFRPKIGFLLAHHASMAHLVKSHFYTGEISYCLQLKGKHYWQKSYKYPTIGASLVYVYTGNQAVLGNGYGGTCFIKLPFANREKIQFNIKLGGGVGYLSRHFDQQTNPKNIAIGSNVNILVNIAFDLTYKWNKGYIGLGIDFTHFSNGGTIIPNLGLNIPSVYLIYGIQTVKKQALLDPAFVPIERSWSFQVAGNFSVHQIKPIGGKMHPIYGITAYMNKRFNEKTGMFLGLDFLYNEALNVMYHAKSPVDWRMVQTGFLVAYELNINRLKIYLGMGVYIKNDFNPNGLFYHKLGVRYEFSKHFFANFAVKTHWAKADYFEYGIGYKLFVKKRM